MRPCREASIGLIAFDIADNTGLTGKDSVVANGDVARAACLSGKDDVIAGLGATGNAGLGNDKAVFPDFDVMAEVDQVVDFSAPADLGRTESGIVQAGAGPDFDIVSEDDIADLGDAGMLPFSVAKPKPSPPMTAWARMTAFFPRTQCSWMTAPG